VNQPLPTNWIGVVGLLLLLILPPLLAAGTTLLVGRRTQRKVGDVQSTVDSTQSTVDTVNNQVTNRHETNLRDDLSAVMEMLADHGRDIRGIRQDIGDLRGELRGERQARNDLEGAVDRRIDRLEEHDRGRRPGT